MAEVDLVGSDPVCLWCGAALGSASHPGSERRFCSAKCRQALHAACRSWAVQAVYEGRLSLDAIRKASQKACALATEAKPAFHDDTPAERAAWLEKPWEEETVA